MAQRRTCGVQPGRAHGFGGQVERRALLHLPQAVWQRGQLALHHLKAAGDAQASQPQPPALCAAWATGRESGGERKHSGSRAACFHQQRQPKQCPWQLSAPLCRCHPHRPPAPSSMMFDGLRSQCRMPRLCRCCSAAARSRPNRSTAGGRAGSSGRQVGRRPASKAAGAGAAAITSPPACPQRGRATPRSGSALRTRGLWQVPVGAQQGQQVSAHTVL